MPSSPSRRSAAHRPIALTTAYSGRRPIFEALEQRQLLTATVTSAIADRLAHPTTPSSDSIDLTAHVLDPNIPGSIAKFETTFGEIDIALTDQATPKTVANFINYITSGRYNNTIFSRSVPGFVEQLGGFSIKNLKTHIPVDPQIPSEFNSANPVHNVRGTVAMALSGGTNTTAQSEWFVSLADNSSNLDTQSGGFTVFGNVIGNGMTIVDKIAALPVGDIGKKTNGALTNVPLRNYPAKGKPPIFFSNLVLVKRATVVPGQAYTVSSSDPSLVNASIVNGHTLQFSYGSGKTGVANVTVTVTSSDGSTASDTFAVTVPTSTGGLVANNDTATAFTGQANVLSPLANDTDTSSAITASSLTITQQPAHGTATIDTTTGQISYTPTTGFTGADTIKYTVKDASNNTSSAATISLNVVAAPISVTIGNGGTARSLTYTEPDGTKVHVGIGGGAAVVTFAGANVTTSTAGGVATVTGADATVTGITITNAKNASASLSINASGGSDGQATVGSITDAAAVAAINTTHTKLTGNINVGSLGALTLEAASGSTITIGSGRASTINIGSASDTSIASSSPLATVRAKEWLNTDGADDSITAPSIGTFQVTSDSAESLFLSGTSRVDLRSAIVGGNITGGSWQIAGNVGAVSAKLVPANFSFSALNANAMAFAGDVAGTFALGNRLGTFTTTGAVTGGSITAGGAVTQITAASAAAGWALAAGNVGAMRFKGDLAGSLTVARVSNVSVGGNLSATIRTTNGFSATGVVIGRLAVAGAITGAKVIASGNVGPITARSMSNSFIYAGIANAVVNANGLPATATDVPTAARIASVTLGNGTTATPAFSNTRIAANTIGPMRLGVVQNDNGGTLFGVAGLKMQSLSAKLAAGGSLTLGPKQLANNGTLTSFIASKQIDLKDFQITLLV